MSEIFLINCITFAKKYIMKKKNGLITKDKKKFDNTKLRFTDY